MLYAFIGQFSKYGHKKLRDVEKRGDKRGFHLRPQNGKSPGLVSRALKRTWEQI